VATDEGGRKQEERMVDALGWRMKFGAIAPSTNTAVQPEYDGMRPRGVTNHISRVMIPDTPVGSDEEFARMLEDMRAATELAIDCVMSCAPAHVIMAMSAETFWEGALDAAELRSRLERRCGVGVSLGYDACKAALACYGDIRRIAVLTPYMPAADAQVRRFFSDCGFEVVNLLGLKCTSPMLMAHESPERLRQAVREVDDAQVELIIQVGTNLAFAAIAAEAEHWLDKPVLAINTCTYWHALRQNGIDDRIDGFGSLLLEH
jgi:maleate isomerase